MPRRAGRRGRRRREERARMLKRCKSGREQFLTRPDSRARSLPLWHTAATEDYITGMHFDNIAKTWRPLHTPSTPGSRTQTPHPCQSSGGIPTKTSPACTRAMWSLSNQGSCRRSAQLVANQNTPPTLSTVSSRLLRPASSSRQSRWGRQDPRESSRARM